MVKVDSFGIPSSDASELGAHTPLPDALDFPRWNGQEWVSDQAVYEMRDQYQKEVRRITIAAQRAQAYAAEADPLFFMSQRGEAAQQDWLAKIEEIKLRFPYEEI